MGANETRFRLAYLRKKYGHTQADLSKVIGMSAQMVGHYECGRHPMSLDTIKKLAEFYGVSESYLLGITEDEGVSEKATVKPEITVTSPVKANPVLLAAELLMFLSDKERRETLQKLMDIYAQYEVE